MSRDWTMPDGWHAVQVSPWDWEEVLIEDGTWRALTCRLRSVLDPSIKSGGVYVWCDVEIIAEELAATFHLPEDFDFLAKWDEFCREMTGAQKDLMNLLLSEHISMALEDLRTAARNYYPG